MLRIRDWTRAGARFVTTRWSLVDRARTGTPGERSEAMNEIARTYWPPVYGFLRARGVSTHEAADLTQAFFADVIVRRALLQSAKGGKLRALMMASLRNYVVDQARRELVRGGRVTHTSINTEAGEAMLTGSVTKDAEGVFGEAWTAAEVAESLRRCEVYWRERHKPAHWEAFEARVARPAFTGVDPVPLDDLAPRLGFACAADAAAAVQVVKKRFKTILEEIGGT